MKNRVVNQHVLRAISIGLAAFIATSTPLTVLASENEGGDESGDDNHTTDTSTTTSSSQESQSSHSQETSAQSKNESSTAVSSAKEATDKSNDAKIVSNDAKESASDAASKVSEAEETKESIENEINSNKDVQKTTSNDTKQDLDDASKNEEGTGTLNTIEKQISDIDKEIEKEKGIVDGALEKAKSQTASLKEDIDDYQQKVADNLDDLAQNDKNSAIEAEIDKNIQDSADAKDAVLDALEEALRTDGDDRVAAAQKADQALSDAKDALEAAKTNLDDAKADYLTKLNAYNEAAILLGVPTINGSSKEDLDKYQAELKAIIDKYNAIAGTDESEGADPSILQTAQAGVEAIKDAQKEYADAAQAAQDVANMANDVITAANSAGSAIQTVLDGDNLKNLQQTVSDAQDDVTNANNFINKADQLSDEAVKAKDKAIENAELADKDAAKARVEADLTIDYYVTQAQLELDDANRDLETARNAYLNAEGKKAKRDAQRELEKAQANVAAKEKALQERKDTVTYIKEDYLNRLQNIEKDDEWKKAVAEVQGYLDEFKNKYVETEDGEKIDDKQAYLDAEKVIMNVTVKVGEVLPWADWISFLNKKECDQTWVDEHSERKDAIAKAESIANKYSKEEQFEEVQKRIAAYLEDEFEKPVEGYTGYYKSILPWDDSYVGNSMKVGDRAEFIEAVSSACAQYYLEALYDFQAEAGALEARRDADAAKGSVEGLDNKVTDTLKESAANVKNAKNILDGIADSKGKLNRDLYQETLGFINDVKANVDTVKAQAINIKTEAGKLEDLANGKANASDLSQTIIEYQTAIDTQKQETEKVYDALRSGTEAEVLKAKLSQLLAQLNAAQATLKKAETAVTEADKVVEAVKTLAQYTNNYASYEDEYENVRLQISKDVRGSKPLATGFMQITKDEDGKIIYNTANDKKYDESNAGVVSRPQSDFMAISGFGGLEVPETIYQAYLTQIAKEIRTPGTGVVDGKGKGISTEDTMPVVYWELVEDEKEPGKLKATGRFFESTSELTDGGKYFEAYTFKKEGDMTTKGYHLDGFLFTYEAPEEGGNDDGGNGGGGTTGGGTTGGGTTGGGGTTTTTTTVTINDAGVPLAAGLDGVVIDDGAVPLAAGLDSVMIDDEGVPLADSIPQTGDNAVPVAPVAATGITALLAAFFMGKRKKED